jgi:PAS domain S-box-containing protein
VEPAFAPDASTTREDAAIRYVLEGTAPHTGGEFFAALVQHLARALGVAGSWVSEFMGPERLRARAFWFNGEYIPDFEYDLRGTPCELVIHQARFVHVPDKVAILYPGDPDLRIRGMVSYLGAPLYDAGGKVVGNLGVLDGKPLLPDPRLEALFRLFAARATAEIQRLEVEEQLRERGDALARLMNSALDAIIELDGELNVTQVNRSARSVFNCEPGEMNGCDFREFLGAESGRKLERLTEELRRLPEGQQHLWIPGGLKGRRRRGEEFPAEASLARFQAGRKSFYTLILRNVHDQLEAERRIRRLTRESEYLQREIEELHNFREIVGHSPEMHEVFENIRRVAPTDATVLITGETGTGKELVARAIHASSRRAQKPLIKVNCAAIPATLIESEFFGHERGAFTGATERREGRFSLADGGTIFLDEVGELPVDLQAKLLRVLQEGEFEPVGTSRTRKVDVRVIAATNRDLRAATREGRFREDLYYRLNVFPISIPPLRERSGDIESLAHVFVEKFSRKMGREPVPLTPDCLRRLHAYDWPGNVRELQNVIERAVITARNGRLGLDAALPLPSREEEVSSPRPTEQGPVIHTDQDIREMERQNLILALEQCGGRISGSNGAAQLLGIPPSTFTSRMKALGVERPRSGGKPSAG